MSAANAAQPPASEWYTIGRSESGQYDVLKSSLSADAETASVQFVLRTTYVAPQKNFAGEDVKTFLESTLVLCKEDIMVSMNQLQYDPKGQHIRTLAKATVYYNPGWRGQVVTELIRFACVPPQVEPSDTPVTKPKGTGV
jgi:hypothetical protein